MTDIKKRKYYYDNLVSLSTEIFKFFERYISYDSAFSFKITKSIFVRVFNELYTSFSTVSKKAYDKIQDIKSPLSSLQIANILIEEWDILFVSFEKELYRYGERFDKIDDFRRLLTEENLSVKDLSADIANSWDAFITNKWLPIIYTLQTTSVKKWASINLQPDSENLPFGRSFQRPFVKSPLRSKDHAFLLTVAFDMINSITKDFKRLKKKFVNGTIDRQGFISTITGIETFFENEIASKQLREILSGRHVLFIDELLRNIKNTKTIASKKDVAPEKEVLFISMVPLVAGIMLKKILKNYTEQEKKKNEGGKFLLIEKENRRKENTKTYFLESYDSKTLGSIEPNPEIELEIKEAYSHLEEMRKKNGCIDFSEDLWIYSQDLLRNISKRYCNKFGKKILKPKYNFIDDSVEIRWTKDDFKLILSISDDIDDIVIYTRNKSGQYINGTIPKEEIINWVLDQFQNF